MKKDSAISKKDIELFMMRQFIDVIETLEKSKSIKDLRKDLNIRKKIYANYIEELKDSEDFEILNLYNETIDHKLEECKEIYSENKKYKTELKKIEKISKELGKKLKNNDKEKLEELKSLIYEICDFDVHLAYKIGLIDGIKIKGSVLN